MGRMIALLPLLCACAPPSLEGSWTGMCLASEGVRVHFDFTDIGEDDPMLQALGTLHLASRPNDFATLDCGIVEGEEDPVSLQTCAGTWSTEAPGPFPFSLNGDLERGDPTDRMLGTCSFELSDGDLELWRTP